VSTGATLLLLLKKSILVLFLVIMLSFEPVTITPSTRSGRTVVEFVMPARRGSLRGHRFRGRRQKGMPRTFIAIHHSNQGYSHV